MPVLMHAPISFTSQTIVQAMPDSLLTPWLMRCAAGGPAFEAVHALAACLPAPLGHKALATAASLRLVVLAQQVRALCDPDGPLQPPAPGQGACYPTTPVLVARSAAASNLLAHTHPHVCTAARRARAWRTPSCPGPRRSPTWCTRCAT
jgi:hypothetical protein